MLIEPGEIILIQNAVIHQSLIFDNLNNLVLLKGLPDLIFLFLRQGGNADELDSFEVFCHGPRINSEGLFLSDCIGNLPSACWENEFPSTMYF